MADGCDCAIKHMAHMVLGMEMNLFFKYLFILVNKCMNICVNNVVGFSVIVSSIFGNNLVINDSHDF